jgi:hypothetical protein
VIALSMVALAGFLALAVDGGRLYLSRRQLQTASDGGALAAAQDLVGTVLAPSGSPADSLYHGEAGALVPYNLVPTWPQGSSFYVSPPGNTITDTVGGYTVTVTSPTGYNNKRASVSIVQSVSTTFASALGFGAVQVRADAVAEAGTNAKTYALFAYASGGSGNTIWDDQSGYALIDNGQDGADACASTIAGPVWSNAKFHVPNPTQATLNVNGNVTVNSASDQHGLYKYWRDNVGFGTGVDPVPSFLAPDVSGLALALPRAVVGPMSSQPVGVDTITNTSSTTYYVYRPGKYTGALSIPAIGDVANPVYIFQNGIYYFTGGAFSISGGTVANTSDGLPKYSGANGRTDLNTNPDGTNGVEFVLDLSATFSASNSGTPAGGSVFFVAPTFVPTGSTGIAFYFPTTNSNTGNVWSETFNATTSNAPRFQIWGTVFDAAPASSMLLTGVQVGPHYLTPDPTDTHGQFAVNGEFIGATLNLYNGNVLGNSTGAPASCPSGSITPGRPALLVQYNSRFAPAPGVNSYLVK